MPMEFDPAERQAMLAYIAVLENGICLCDEARADGDPGYGLRIIRCLASRIKAAAEAAEDETRQTMH
jgi:hypothetical protein